MNRLLWVIEKQFDISSDIATWLEIVANLRARYDIRLLTGYRYRKIQPETRVNDIEYYDSVKIPVINRLTTYVKQLSSFTSSVKSFRPTIVLFNSSNTLLMRYAFSIRNMHGAKLILDLRTLPVSSGRTKRYIDKKLLGLNLRYAARWFDGVTYITEEMRRFCISEYKLPFHRSAVWTSGVNSDVFCPGPFKHDNGPFKILYHGAIAKKRGLDNVVRAIALLKNVDVRMELLGRGDAVAELQGLVNELGIGDKVSFINVVSHRDVGSTADTRGSSRFRTGLAGTLALPLNFLSIFPVVSP